MDLRQSVPEKIHELFKNTFLAKSQKDLKEIYQSIAPIFEEVDKIDSLINSEQPGQNRLKEVDAHKEAIYQLIRNKWTQPSGWDFADEFADFIEGVQYYTESLPEFQKEEQSPDRFKPLDTDGWYVRIKKYLKNSSYQLSIFPLRLINWILVKLKKKPKAIRRWYHTIPVRRTVNKVYQTDLLKSLTRSEKSKYQSLLEDLLNLKTLENSSDVVISLKENELNLEPLSDLNGKEQIEKIKQQIRENQKKYVKETKEVLVAGDIRFVETMDKADTTEFSKKQLNEKYIRRRFARYNKAWFDHSEDWSRTLFALFDDWRLDLEINRLKYIAYQELFEAKKSLEIEKKKYLKSVLKISDTLINSETRIKKEPDISRLSVQVEKETIQKKLDQQLIPEILVQFDNKKLIGIIREIEIKLERDIEALAESRALVRIEQYGRPLKEQDVNYIKPNELISFEVFQDFLSLLNKLKNSITNQLESIIKLMPDIDNIVLFSMETAINATPPEQEKISSENIQIILNGIGRAKNRISDLNLLIEKLYGSYEQHLFEAIQMFTSQAVILMQNENALAIRIKLLKAKALQQTKSYRNKFRTHLFRIFILTRNIFRDRISFISSRIEILRKRYFLQPSDAIITQEISDFLSESEKYINQLPVIYRRLYKVEPVTDMDLFIGRELEFDAIKSSHQKWIDGRASSTAIIGEKWGGLSSFINYLNVNLKFNYPVIRISPSQKYYQKDKFYKLLAVSLSIKSGPDQEAIVDAIKNSESKKIVIIEDIQHMFLRSMNGFDAMRSLIEIINQTQNEIFWILTCTQYAWNYLVKSFQINDLFHKIVVMESMKNEEITSIIKKRNHIGGFKIIFIPPEELQQNKKFNSSNEEEQQTLLEKRFLKRLNDFAESNISMALIFWLLSTKKVTEDQIFIGDFDSPDHSFLHVMTQIRIYILLALILHDGLSFSELSLVNNQAPDDLRLQITSLRDDGIIINQSDLLMVNPLIYRNVVSVLKSKNLIH